MARGYSRSSRILGPVQGAPPAGRVVSSGLRAVADFWRLIEGP